MSRPAGDIRAAAILFVGGSGNLKVWRKKKARSKNFLFRSRHLFAERNVMAVVVDAPSDNRNSGLLHFRHSDDHYNDVKSVLTWVRTQTDAPVWLIGTSRGSVSVAHLGPRLDVAGLVMTSTVTRASNRNSSMVTNAPLGKIRQPVLLVHHRDDECSVTPARDINGIARLLTSSAGVTVKLFSGGENKGTNPCSARTYHGFLGIEKDVVGFITGWLTTRPAR